MNIPNCGIYRFTNFKSGLGRRYTKEHREAMSRGHRTKLSSDTVYKILQLLDEGVTTAQITRDFGIGRHKVYTIRQNRKHPV